LLAFSTSFQGATPPICGWSNAEWVEFCSEIDASELHDQDRKPSETLEQFAKQDTKMCWKSCRKKTVVAVTTGVT
jgi:hypothetical protein